ncbi:MAG: EAL domain-containing protein, partial [Desulfovibrionaceae bacterium]
NTDADLRGLLQRFNEQLASLLVQCRAVNAQLQEMDRAWRTLSAELDHLDRRVAETVASEGPAGPMRRVAALLAGLRESALRMALQHSLDWPEHYYQPQEPDDALNVLSRDLLARMRALAAAPEPLTDIGLTLTADLQRYQDLHVSLHEFAMGLRQQAVELERAMSQTLVVLSARDAEILDTGAALQRRIHTATGRTSTLVALLAAVMAALVTALTTAFMLRNLRRPMDKVRAAMAAISDGEFNTTVHLGRHDEWEDIERALNSMAMNLATYYAEIQENRAELVQAYGELKRAEAKYRTIADYNYDMEGWLAPDGALIYISPSCERITGYPPERFLATPELLHQIIHRDDMGLWLQHMQAATEPGGEGADFRIFRRDGRMRWISQVTRTLPGNQGLRFSMRDITDRKFMEKQLEYESLHDPLTGLSNRALCLDRIRLAQERAKRRGAYFAVVFMDLDRFKIVNDSLGHAMGDKLLIETSTRLLKAVREVDTVSRFGGDEFILLLEDLNLPREGIRTVRRVRELLRESFGLEGHDVPLSASFGVVLSSAAGSNNPEEILQNANLAMHRAKEAGRDRIKVFNPHMLDQAQGLMHLEHDLRAAVAGGEFSLVYQPIYALANSRLTGFEALVRWDHPTRGRIDPGEFIPVAEGTGIINELGRYVLARACRDFVRWATRFPDAGRLTMAVNVSSRQFARHDLVEMVQAVLAETGMPPRRLKLEITETSIMEHGASVVLKLGRLKQLGILMSIDDFGTGYSSLAYLQKFPLDNLKIDLSFVKMLDVAPENVEIVRAIITLAHTLGLEVVAEGVEKPEHLEVLCSLDCEYGQGYLLARPLEEAQVLELLAAQPGNTPSCEVFA